MSMMQIKKLFHYEKGSLQSSKCIPGEYVFITASSDWKSHKEYTHNCEALIFAAAASGSLGRTHYVNGKFISSDLCFIITPKDSERYPVDLKFYHLLFQAFKDDIVKNTKAGTSKEAIGLSAFGKYEIPYFDIEKQKETKDKFVNVQGSTNLFTSELNQQLDLVKQLRQAFLREAMQGKLVPQDPNDEPASVLLEKIKVEKERLIKEKKIKKDKPLPPITEDEIPYELPEGWVWCRLEAISNNITDGDHQAPPQCKDGIPFMVISNIKNNSLIFNETRFVTETYYNNLSSERKPLEGDILYTVTGSLGIPVLVQTVHKFCVQRHIAIIKPSHFISNKWMYYYLKSPLTIKQANDIAWGIAQRTIPLKGIRKYLVPMPPITEQHRIVAKLDQLMQYCDQLEAGIRQSQQHNEQLLQQVLREALEG